MTLKAQLNDSVREAMKSGDEIRKRTVRMVLAAIKQAEVDKRVELDDTAVMGLIQKEMKNRRESLEEARKAGAPILWKPMKPRSTYCKHSCQKPCLLRN